MSLLGTKNAPTYPEYVPGFGSGSPWGTNVTAYTSNPYKNIPDTGMTRKYKFVVSYQDIAPDGVTKKGLVVNGAFPGPTIEANWGDWIEVEVENKLPDEGTTIHWHGLLQKGTPWFDGVPSVSQCPVAPGKTLTYRFRADQFGTSWSVALLVKCDIYSSDSRIGIIPITAPSTLAVPLELLSSTVLSTLIMMRILVQSFFQIGITNLISTS